jgi:hypothetical protein
MFNQLRKHLTPSTFIAFLALVFALTGGAFAATGGSGGGGGGSKVDLAGSHTLAATTAKAKPAPKGKAGPRGPAGKNGAAGATGATGPAGATGPGGPQGPQGAAGVKGETGAAGTNGTNGKDGTDGTNGMIGFTKILPKGETETGTWATRLTEGEETALPLTFSIPLKHELEEAKVQVVGKTGNGSTCPGTAEAPTAVEGNLCVYEGENFESHVELPSRTSKPYGLGIGGAGTAGALLSATGKGTPAIAWGTWAVTAE